jgi:hypothetical protein
MSVYDNRFSGDHRLIFLLYNQMQRRQVMRTVAAKCITDNAYFKEFTSMVLEPTFHAKLVKASSNIEDPASQIFIKKIGKMLNIFGGDVPFSLTEKGQNRGHLYSMVYTFGMPSFFITLSPPDQDNHIFMHIITMDENSKVTEDIKFEVFKDKTILERLKLIVKYPGLNAKLFHQMVESLLKNIFGIESSKDVKKTLPLSSDARLTGDEIHKCFFINGHYIICVYFLLICYLL